MSRLYLLDTNVLSHLADPSKPGHAEAHLRLATHAGYVVLSPVCMGEIEYGLALPHGLSAEKVTAVRDYQNRFEVLEIKADVAEPYGAIRAHLFEKFGRKDRKKQKSVSQLQAPSPDPELKIQENDLWLASQAIACNAVLVTADKKMQPIVDAALALNLSLTVEDWTTVTT